MSGKQYINNNPTEHLILIVWLGKRYDTRFLRFSAQILLFLSIINFSNKMLLSYKSYVQGKSCLCIPKAIKSESLKPLQTENRQKNICKRSKKKKKKVLCLA